MRFQVDTVLRIAETVEAEPSRRILSTANPKTMKGENHGYLTAILHLAPHKAAGFNVCAGATAGCIAACLNTAGRGGFDSRIQRARIRKTKWFRADRAGFMLQLERDIEIHLRLAARSKLEPCVRLNGTSDIPWEKVRATFADGTRGTIFERFPQVTFYDYTKLPLRFGKLPPNYDLTFSLAEGNDRASEHVLANDGRVAVVFRNSERPNARPERWTLPGEWNGRPVIDADAHDLRFLEPTGVYCGLKAKGNATRDTSGFVRDIEPA